MNETVIRNIENCKQSVEQIKASLIAEINQNMENGIFEVSTDYKKLITFSTESIKFLALYSRGENTRELPQEPIFDFSSTARDDVGDDMLDIPEQFDDYTSPEVDFSEEDFPEEDLVEETQSILEMEDFPEEDESFEKEETIEVQERPFKANIIGAAPVAPIRTDTPPFDSICFDERNKPIKDFVYDKKILSAKRGGSRDKHEIMIYVSPLMLVENLSNVPILVHAYCDGRVVTASSYDTKQDAKSIVQIEINDFHLLCRGEFKDGHFRSLIFTTGISAMQGDELQTISVEEGTYRVENYNSVGHIKFKEGDTLFEVYPLSKTENEYVAITITEEFTDYEVVALTYGTTRPIYIVNGAEKELVAYHDGDTFTAELISANR